MNAMSTIQEQADSPVSAVGRRRRVLVSALAVSPARGSEAGIGWNIGSRLAKYHDVTLMCVPGTHWPHRQEIEDYLREHGPIPGLTMLYIEPTRLFRWLDHTTNFLLRPLFYIGYASWQRAAYRTVRKLHAEKPFELTHHLNILGYREPGYLWKLPIPFFWGPVAGASNMPWRFFPILSWPDRLAYGLRNIANEIQKRLSWRVRKAARTAVHIWAIGEDNRRMFTEVFGVPAECLCESGGTPNWELASVKRYDPSSGPLRLAWAGIHVGRKALQLVLYAMGRLGGRIPLSLTVLGSGPQTRRWQKLSQQLGIDHQVRWVGYLPHDQAMVELSKAHVFVFPSLQEASSTVTLEALSLGLPVICHDACGMGFIVNQDCGIKIPMVSPAVSIEGFAEAIRRLYEQPAEVTRLSQGALKRSEELSWDYAARQIAEGYDRVLRAMGR